MQHSLAGIEIVPGMLRFVLVNDRNRHIIGYLEPRPDLQRAFCPQVIFLEGFISDRFLKTKSPSIVRITHLCRLGYFSNLHITMIFSIW